MLPAIERVECGIERHENRHEGFICDLCESENIGPHVRLDIKDASGVRICFHCALGIAHQAQMACGNAYPVK